MRERASPNESLVRPGRRAAVLARSVFASAALTLTAGCTFESTQVLVVVTTTVPAGHRVLVRSALLNGDQVDLSALASQANWTRFEIVSGLAPTLAGGIGARDAEPDYDAGAEGAHRGLLPGSFAVVPSPTGPADQTVTLVIEGFIDPGPTQSGPIRRVLTFRFATHRSQTLAVTLSADCLGPETGCVGSPCTVQQSCEENGESCGDDGFCAPRGVLLHPPGTGICNPGWVLCDGACVNLVSDNHHCGQCGHACPDPEYCQASTCVCETRCGATCVDLTSDRMHCGACGHACVAPQRCTSGACM